MPDRFTVVYQNYPVGEGALLVFVRLRRKLSRNVSDGLMIRLWKTEDACFNHIMIKAGFYDPHLTLMVTG
ncbi:hypothetical protein PO856_003215 [Pectobacterium brasiliense]|uniref:hypothetical protein n=1 Tax=Pectobacterium brasiliense TaxID=180957 RepID=UPI002406AFC1|nr:hypothetical protein [Pectobacterium brasiliense]MDG0805954.1 hypothetical protein [Pectobacterium brasiliense]